MITLPIHGMTCASCAGRVERALRKLPGVQSASVNLATETASVEAPGLALDALTGAIVEAGYDVPETSTELLVDGMTCASCTGRVERALAKVPGVLAASVNLATNLAHIRHLALPELPELLVSAIRQAGYEAVPAGPDAAFAAGDELDTATPMPDAEAQGTTILNANASGHGRRPGWRLGDGLEVALATALSVPLVLPMLADLAGHHWMLPALWQFLLATPVLFIFGARFFKAGWKAVRAGSANMDVLVALGTGAAWALSMALWWRAGPDEMPHLYFESAAVVVTLVRLGKWLETRAKRRTLAALDALQALRPAQATVLREGQEVLLPVARLRRGDVVVVRPGERLPVDGVVREGSSHVDESLITGESLPVARGPGDAVTGGSVNAEGLLKVEATALGAESQIARIVRLVASAQAAKAPIQEQVDKVSAIFVPVVLGLALLTWLGWLVMGAGLPEATIHAVSVLVIACPCALGLATPATLMVASGLAARRGILVRDASALERLRDARIVAFDKTGTLTQGRPQLVRVVAAPGIDEQAVLATAAALQMGSEHPLARAVLGRAREHALVIPPAINLRAVAGRGVCGEVHETDERSPRHLLCLGSASWMSELGVDMVPMAPLTHEHEEQGRTISWLVLVPAAPAEGAGPRPAPLLLGCLAFGDAPRDTAAATVAALQAQGLRCVLVSGDNPGAAHHLAGAVGIRDVHAEVKPEGKSTLVAQLKSLATPGAVVMVGDGINDAPALANADVGLAMAHADGGTDVAMHTAGITLLRGDPWSVVEALALARATGSKIRQNLFWAFAYNAVGIPLAMAGQLSPIVAGGAMALSSVCVVTNALWLGRWQAPRPAPSGDQRKPG